MSKPRAWFHAHRHRLARLVLAGAVLAVGLTVWSELPRTTVLEYGLGTDHRDVIELRVAYLQDGDAYHGARFDFPAGAPRHVRHRVSLPSGRFEVRLDVVSRKGRTVRTVRPLLTPADGLVKIPLTGLQFGGLVTR